MASWLGASSCSVCFRLAMLQRYRRTVDAPAAVDWFAWRFVWTSATLVSGAFWGATAWIFYGRGSGIQQTGPDRHRLHLLHRGRAGSREPSPNLRRLRRAVLPADDRAHRQRRRRRQPAARRRTAADRQPDTLLARSYRQALQRVTELKLDADTLLRQLRVEKAAAEAARQEAEIANRAKTQFFAAASHDLRQPLHAMGLFAEALRQRIHQPEVAQLVNSINESVDALEGLFSELLDITRIDSGGMDVAPRGLPAGGRSCAGCACISNPRHSTRACRCVCAAVATSCARIRCWSSASCAISSPTPSATPRTAACSSPAGDAAGMSASRSGTPAWASTRGIANASSRSSTRCPAAQTRTDGPRKGLGLGLAIVARLARLMERPLELRSEPGRGSVFTLQLPIAA